MKFLKKNMEDITNDIINGDLKFNDEIVISKDYNYALLSALDLSVSNMDKNENNCEFYRKSFLDINSSDELIKIDEKKEFREDFDSDLSFINLLTDEQKKFNKSIKIPEINLLLTQYEQEELTPELIRKFIALNIL